MKLTEKQKTHVRVELAQKVTVSFRTLIFLIARQESEYLRSKRATIDKSQFTVLKIIGRGAFGEVLAIIPFFLYLTRLGHARPTKRLASTLRHESSEEIGDCAEKPNRSRQNRERYFVYGG